MVFVILERHGKTVLRIVGTARGRPYGSWKSANEKRRSLRNKYPVYEYTVVALVPLLPGEG